MLLFFFLKGYSMFAKVKKFVDEHELETLVVVLTATNVAMLYLFHQERNIVKEYRNDVAKMTEALRLGYTASYNANTGVIHMSKPK